MRNTFNTGSLVNFTLDFLLLACTFFLSCLLCLTSKKHHINIFIDIIGWLFVKMRKYLVRLFLGRSGIFKISFSHNLILAGDVMPGTRRIM